MKPFLYVCIIVLAFSIMFGIVGKLIGRESGGIITYGGGSIALFNDYIQFPIHSTGFGVNTFDVFYKGLYKLHLISQYTPMNTQEFRNINGISIGNVYTALRSYYMDFGLTGIIIFPLIYGSIFGYLYRKLKSINISGISIELMIYAYMNWTLVLSPYSETFDNTFLSFGFFINIFIFILLKIYYKIDFNFYL